MFLTSSMELNLKILQRNGRAHLLGMGLAVQVVPVLQDV